MITKQVRKEAEFDDVRSSMYEIAIRDYSLARAMDMRAMQSYLSPKQGEYILGIGEGNGFFCRSILDSIGKTGKYTVTDPSEYQIINLQNRINDSQLEVVTAGAESIPVKEGCYDKVWSFGAFHHCPNQTEAMRIMYKSLKSGGKAVICDVFSGSTLAEHFDTQVARYCNTGHEVKFLSDAFARSLCYLAGFKDSKVKIEELPQKWVFETEKDLGRFMYNLHAMIYLPGCEESRIESVLKGCKDILGVTKSSTGQFELNWPMKVLEATK